MTAELDHIAAAQVLAEQFLPVDVDRGPRTRRLDPVALFDPLQQQTGAARGPFQHDVGIRRAAEHQPIALDGDDSTRTLPQVGDLDALAHAVWRTEAAPRPHRCRRNSTEPARHDQRPGRPHRPRPRRASWSRRFFRRNGGPQIDALRSPGETPCSSRRGTGRWWRRTPQHRPIDALDDTRRVATVVDPPWSDGVLVLLPRVLVSTTIPIRIAAELQVQSRQVEAAVQLLDEGATVPFIARYRKEVTGGLDDVQLRALEERLVYLRELEERRTAILASIEEQGKLTPELKAQIEAAATKVALEDLYLPYKQKRRTKAMIAREAGLQRLADSLLADPTLDPKTAAAAFVAADKGVADVDAALEGARFILIEQFAEDAELLGRTRKWLDRDGLVVTRVVKDKEQDPEAQRFRDYFGYDEPLARVPSHRALAIFRARKEGYIDGFLGMGDERQALSEDATGQGQLLVMERFGIANKNRKADGWLADTARLSFRAKIALHLETELFSALRDKAEAEAIKVFAANLRDLLLAAPAGPKVILGLDPGLRTGCKIAVVDRTGRLLATATIYPHVPREDWDGSLQVLAMLCKQHGVQLVSIGNGTASRETDKLAVELIKQHPELGLQKLVVSEAGASVYSASERGSQEFPDLDVSLRGAVSIARRLQDPLAELVKIDPKSIGVGQYQHDVNQVRLGKALDAVVEDCVNGVGVDLNTASEDLLRRVAGLNSTLAKNIVGHRDANGAFKTRRDLLQVSRLGPKAFEQCAGFLRIQGGDNPLDASGVHPEAYPVVERILARAGRGIREVIGDRAFLRGLKPQDYVDDKFGLPTVNDILAELEKPGRDPRPEFKTATFQDGVTELKDLQPGMLLEGVVTNVTQFGAFVDIGVHQDGLVHISQLSDKFVEDPREVVKAGQVVKVKVLQVDLERKRIALTMKLHERPQGGGGAGQGGTSGQSGDRRGASPGGDRRGPPQRPSSAPRDFPSRRAEPEPVNPLAAQLAKLKNRLT
ncbi:MAG: RNA-binding transcriptional accessory protein [Planctomycetes bacterium]|nr:RNA-binding transcriptional accessory protein [Planctomycetota bacterium]